MPPLSTAIITTDDLQTDLLIVGNGMAATALLEDLAVRGNGPASVTVIGDEAHGGYNRILLSSVLAGDKSLPSIITHPPEWYGDRGYSLLTGDSVDHLDPSARLAITRSGRRIHWGKLVLATGASPVRPPIPGLSLPGVCGFRSIADVETMLGQATQGGQAVVIGGGILGLEAAWGLLRRGMRVHVIHMADCLMERQLDPIAAHLLRTDLEQHGLTFLTGRTAAAVTGDHAATGVTLSDGSTLAADLVVVAAGIRPNTELAIQAGLTVGRGILVDDHMQTSHPDILAIGECVEHAGQCYGLVLPVRDMAKVCAAHLSDQRREQGFKAPDLSAKLKIPGIQVFSAGLIAAANDDDHELVYQSDDQRVYKKVVLRQGRIVGAVLYGDVADSAQLWQWMIDRIDITPFCPQPAESCAASCPRTCPGNHRQTGWISLPSALDPSLLPDEAVVCHCNGVTKGAILACARQSGGACSLNDIRQKTGAGSGCGQCLALTASVLALALTPEQAARLAEDQKKTLRRNHTMGFGFRWWHRSHAVMMSLLLLTGLVLHFPGSVLPVWLLSFEWAYRLHKWNGLGVIGAFAVFLGLTAFFKRRWKADLDGWVMFALMPLCLLTGLAFLWPALLPDHLMTLAGITPVALGHLLLAVLVSAFLIQHLSTAPVRWWRKRRLRA